MSTYLIATYPENMPVELYAVDGGEMELLDDIVSRASYATIHKVHASSICALVPELRGATRRPAQDWVWCEQIARLSNGVLSDFDSTDFARLAAHELLHRPMIVDVVRSERAMHNPLSVIAAPSWVVDPEDGSAMRYGYLHAIPGMITISDRDVDNGHAADVAAAKLGAAGMTHENLTRAVSLIARLSPIGESIARRLGVETDPSVI